MGEGKEMTVEEGGRGSDEGGSAEEGIKGREGEV